MTKLTKASAIAAIRRIGRELTVRCDDGKWRISIAIPAIQMVNGCDYKTAKTRNEDIAAYADSIEEAIANAKELHAYYSNNTANGV